MKYILHGKYITVCDSSTISGRIVVYLYNKQIVALRFDHTELGETVTVDYIHNEYGGRVSLKSFFKTVRSNGNATIPTYIELNGTGNIHLCSIYQNDRMLVGESVCNVFREKLFIPTNATLPKAGACKFTVEDICRIEFVLGPEKGWYIAFRFKFETYEIVSPSKDDVIRLSATHTTGGILIRNGLVISGPSSADDA